MPTSVATTADFFNPLVHHIERMVIDNRAAYPPERTLLTSGMVIAAVEKTQPVRVFTEIEWDDDGYWDIEFINTDNRRSSLRIDPVSGEPFSRRRR